MPVYSDGCVFFVTPYAENGRLYRLQADGGQFRVDLVWTHPIDTVTGCGLLVGDTLLVAGYRRPKHWFAIDWATGQTEYELEDFTTGAAVYADRRFYIFDERANVGLVQLGPDGLEIVGRFRLPLDRVRDAWAHPVVHDGRLYVRHHDTLWCFAIAAD